MPDGSCSVICGVLTFTSPVMLQKIEVFWDVTAKHCSSGKLRRGRHLRNAGSVGI